MSKQAPFYFDRTLDGSERVDKENGIVRGVSIITSGVTARGHNLEVDRKTLEQIHECAEKRGRVPVKWNHKTGADAVNGYLDNFHFDGNKLKADWHLLKSHSQFSQALELADVMPSEVGLSAAFMGKEEKKGGKAFARCSELISVDLVANPAANPDGLFEAKVDASQNDMSATAADNTELSVQEKLLAKLESIETRFSALEDFNKKLIAFAEDDGEDEVEDDAGDADEVGDEAGDDEGAEFSSPLEAALVYLQAKVESQAQAEEDAKLAYAFDTINDKVAQLMELNEALAAENEALHLAAKEGLGKTLSGGQESKVRLFSADSNKDEFEARVTELETGGKKRTDAILLARKEDPARYEQHLIRIGALTK